MSYGDEDDFEEVAEIPVVSRWLEDKTHNSVVQEVHARAAPVEDWLQMISEIYKERREMQAL